MKYPWAAVVAGIAVCGCGGTKEDAKPQAAATPQATPATISVDSKPIVTAVEAAPAPAQSRAKKDDEPPGLVLPESEPDAVGAKGPELPIR